MWEFYLCRNTGLERTHKTLNRVPCYHRQLHHLINWTNPIWNEQGFCFQYLFSKSCSFLSCFARFWRLEKIHCKAILQSWGTGRGLNSSPHLLTLPLLCSQMQRTLLRFEEDLTKPTLPSKPSEDRLNLKSQALIKYHQISNEKSCCSVIPGYVKRPETIPDWKPALHGNYSSRNMACLPTLFSFNSAFQRQRGTFPRWKFTAFFPCKCHCYFSPLAILSLLMEKFFSNIFNLTHSRDNFL